MFERKPLYPLLFIPMYLQVRWGGTKFKTILKRKMPDDEDFYGEAWDVCDRPEVSSEVENGPWKGTSLHELMNVYGKKTFTSDNFNGEYFPVMIKIIDAMKNLSIQTHPNHIQEKQFGENAEGKQEMWYILQADRNAKIYVGLKPEVTHTHLAEAFNTPEIANLVEEYLSFPNDAYFINYGCIHSIGGGNLVLEIQENSLTSFRIYDWGEVDFNGEPRPLQLEEAMQCIDVQDRFPPRISAVSNVATTNCKYSLVNKCTAFSVEELQIIKPWPDSTRYSRSAHFLTAVRNSFFVEYDGKKYEVPYGRTILLPACLGEYVILPNEQPFTLIRTILS